MSVISIQRLTKRYGRRIGVQGLTLTVPEGTLFGFLGPNGSGKTTTIRVLMGLLKPTEGRARIFGLDCTRASHRVKHDVGYLPGDLRLYPWLTCQEALRIFGRIRGRDLTAAGGELAEDFGLDLDVRASSMSRGMRQKLGLIISLAHRPQLLILDEPTASLDPLMQEKLLRRLRDLASDGHTVFFSSHSLAEVEDLCHRVAILRNGKLVADETLDAMRARARRVVVITWSATTKPDEIDTPEFLKLYERHGAQWTAELAGTVPDLVRWAARQPIADLSIGQPDLARLFQRYYE